MLLPLLAFLFGSLLIAAGALALSPGAVSVVQRRLGEVTGAHVKEATEDAGYNRMLIDTLKKMVIASSRR